MISLAQISNNQNVELDPKTLSQPLKQQEYGCYPLHDS